MRNIGLNELREMYLSFFQSKDHLRLPSFPLVPQGDNSLLLINSGMAPLKPYFAGEVTPPHPRVTTCQKCIRTPDIERVGKTSRHGTFFEMLGNFSFGDYFKKEATAWAWEFITEVLEIPKDKLYVTVYLDDDEAWDIWVNDVGVEPSHMSRLGKADNFWEIGSGPCGPCSEIYYDRGEQYSCGSPDCTVGCDCDRYVEFWNLVFTQFDNDGFDNYTPLAKKNIDTGMGLERLACIMQGVESIFDVDTIRNITSEVTKTAGVKYGDSYDTDVSLRVITDHIRSTTMMVCDGVLPSNEGRGYVLRRLLRRAARHGKLLGIDEPFLCELCLTVIRESSSAYPELEEKKEYIQKVIRNEEDSFDKTIDNGLRILNSLIEDLKSAGQALLSGENTFKLYDTYGFPIDLTLEIAEEQGIEIDKDGFDALMQQQRERARAATASLGDFGWASLDLGLDKNLMTEFTGYTSFVEENAKVWAIIAESELRATAYEGEEVIVVLDKTPFYAESGGQIADRGTISAPGVTIEINDVRKSADGKYMHIGEVLSGQLNADQSVSAAVDASRRRAIMRAHSATHLLQRALRDVLGSHVEQAGSLVNPDHLRFDFTHFTSILPSELVQITDLVNGMIFDGMPIEISELPINEAKKLGAMALFGEKYGDVVRVVKMGDKSIEFCGGTHLDNTSKVGPFRIEAEFSVASGVRRIEAVVGKEFMSGAERRVGLLSKLSEVLKAGTNDLLKKAEQFIKENKDLRQSLDQMQSKLLLGDAERFLFASKKVEGLNVVTATLQNMDANSLRKMGDLLRDKDETVVAVLSTIDGDDDITFHAVCGKQAVTAGIHAGELVKAVSAITGGSGGGKADSAMGGGKEPIMLDNALAITDNFIAANIKR